jgi:predicted metalloendopeptidase
LGNVTLTNNDIVIVNNVKSIRNISFLITQQSPRILQNYMIWRFVTHRVPNMPKRFQTILNKLRKAVLGIDNEQPQTIRCRDYVNNNMAFAVSKLYIKKYFDKFARREVCIIKLYIITI